MLDVTGDVAGPFALNYPEFPDSCLWRYLGVAVNVDQVLVDGLDRHLVKLGDELLREPDSISVQADLKLRCAVGVDEELPLRGWQVGVVRHARSSQVEHV